MLVKIRPIVRKNENTENNLIPTPNISGIGGFNNLQFPFHNIEYKDVVEINEETGEETVIGQDYYIDVHVVYSSRFSVPSDYKEYKNRDYLFDTNNTIDIIGLTQEQIDNNSTIKEKEDRIKELKKYLTDTDYVVIKIAEGAATTEEYQDIIDQRVSARNEINTLENDIATLEEE